MFSTDIMTVFLLTVNGIDRPIDASFLSDPSTLKETLDSQKPHADSEDPDKTAIPCIKFQGGGKCTPIQRNEPRPPDCCSDALQTELMI